MAPGFLINQSALSLLAVINEANHEMVPAHSRFNVHQIN